MCKDNVLHTVTAPDQVIPGKMESCFHLFTPNSDLIIQMLQHKLRHIRWMTIFPTFYLPVFGDPMQIAASATCSDRNSPVVS